MQKTDISVLDLVTMVEKGELRLPEMQRGYVWRGTRVRDLLDSLYRGYPSGNILVWETDVAMPLRDMAVGQQDSPFKGFKLLLDGQQRLTSLSAALRGELVHVRGRRRPIDILFNLDHPESLEEVLEVDEDDDGDPDGVDDDDTDEDEIGERVQRLTFVVSSRRIAAQPNWVSVTDIFKSDSDAPFLKKAGVANFDDPRYEKYTQRLQKLRQVRRYEQDFPIQLGTLVRALVVHATGQSRFKTVGNLPMQDLQDGWDNAVRGLQFAVHFARNNAGIESPALLTSPYALLSLAYLAKAHNYALSQAEAEALRFWLQIENGSYSRGSSETYLDQDLTLIKNGKGAIALLDSVRQQFGRVHFDVEEFEGRNRRASLFRLVFQALKASSAKDWLSGINISVANYGHEHKLQFHHIFPKALLQAKYTNGQINEIANLAFIGGRTNRSISARPPKEYLPKIIAKQGEEALSSQCVPLEPSLWEIDRFLDFLSERRKLLAARVNQYVGKSPIG